jgi:hypothetical protein
MFVVLDNRTSTENGRIGRRLVGLVDGMKNRWAAESSVAAEQAVRISKRRRMGAKARV